MRSVRVGVHVVLALAVTSAVGTGALAQTQAPASRPASGAAPGASGSTPATPSAGATVSDHGAVPASGAADLPPEEDPSLVPPPPVVPVVRPPTRPPWGHRNQVGLRLGVAFGGRIAIRYGDGDRCNTAGQTFCPQGGPLMFDAALSLGVTETIEIEARFRYGLPDFNNENPLAGGIGVRYHGSDTSPFRFVFGVAAFADFTAPGTAISYRTDIQVRLEEGIQYDIGRNFGVFFQIGETIGFIRSLSFAGDGQIGIQVRVP